MKLMSEMLAAGCSDKAIARRIGGLSWMSVNRHRINHIERPAKLIAAAANRDRDAREERNRAVVAAESGDSTASFLALDTITASLRKTHDRLERVSDKAEVAGQAIAVASLAGQQTRVIETRAKLGSVGGYAPPRAKRVVGQAFELNIIFRDGQNTRISGTTTIDPDEIPAAPLALDAPEEDDEDQPSE
jgi:hypothetical protein